MDRRFIVILLVLIVVFFGFIFFNKFKSSNTTSSSSQGSQNYYGNMQSSVTLTEFVDFQCEACYAYYPVVKEVKEKYKDQVKFQVRHFPITSSHQFAMQAARNAEAAARQGKFWEMHDKIFEGQKMWEQTKEPQASFDQYAEVIGLDMTRFKADLSNSEVAANINKDVQDVTELGGSGTPTFVLNGKKIENPRGGIEEFSKVIDEALAQAGQQQ